MKRWRIPVRQAVAGAVLALAMTITMARVRRTCRTVRKGPGIGREQRMGRVRGRAMVKGKELLNKPRGEMISLASLCCSCRRKCIKQTRTRRANRSGYVESWKHRPPCQFPQMMILPLPSRTANLNQNLILTWICAWRMMWTPSTALIKMGM